MTELTPARRRQAVAEAGHTGDEGTARAGLADPEGGVRATALTALDRIGVLTDADVDAALGDEHAAVRGRACELCVRRPGLFARVVGLLDDPQVAETACWTLGELADPAAVAALSAVATGHDDALVRESAVAALGAIGDPAGLPAILAACQDKPTVRRRAVLALAPFEGPEVDAALAAAAQDKDWQVRQAAAWLEG